MAKLPEVLKDGILSGDWDKICKVYTAITGEEISPPKQKSEAEELASLEIPEFGPTLIRVPPEQVKTVVVKPDFIASSKNNEAKQQKTHHARKEPFRTGPREQRFTDNFTLETGDLKSENPQLQKLYGAPKPKADRSSIDGASDTGRLIFVKCSLCGKEEYVAPIHATQYDPEPEDNTYKCNDCIVKGASR